MAASTSRLVATLNPSILWALGSTFGAAINDLLFKRFNRRPGSLGLFIAGTGLVWALLLLGMDGARVAAPNQLTLAYGIPAGLFSVTANILLICALAGMDASVGATIYRLNFIPVMCLAVPLLGEHLNAAKLGGLATAAAAVFLFARDGRQKKTANRARFSVARGERLYPACRNGDCLQTGAAARSRLRLVSLRQRPLLAGGRPSLGVVL
ncbi:MAG TPA: hypothetical protein VHR86_09985 [Armatimonadota bacterium]|nr:hypothetical protein [Armatimonadota bacterium]